MQEEDHMLFRDQDKLSGDRDVIKMVFEGNGKEFIEEFLKKGYRLKK